MNIVLKMTPLEWAKERLKVCELLAEARSGKERQEREEDAAYWRAIIADLIKARQ